MRNHANTGGTFSSTLTPPFTAEIQSARTLSYSRELVLRIDIPNDGTGPPCLKAIAYAPRKSDLRPGDTIVLHARAHPLGGENISGNGSLFQQELIRKGFRATLYVNEDQYTVLSRGIPSWRHGIRRAIENRTAALFNSETRSLLNALYFGNKNFIGLKTIMLFREVGALHILAASGTHCAIIALIPFLLLSPFRVSKRTIFIVSIALMGFYLYITDMPVSLQRAFIMCAIFGATFLFDFDRNPFNALFIAGTALIILHPYEPYSIGFQLTFGATFGILAWYRIFRERLSALPKFLRNPIALTLAAQVLVFPIIFFHFREINIASVISNLLIVPGIQVILAGSILITAASAILPWDISVIALSVDRVYTAVTAAAGFISRLHLHFSNIDRGTALIVPYLLYLSPLVPIPRIRHIQLPFLAASFILAAGTLYYSAGPVDRCGILRTNNSVMASVNTGETPVLFGRLGSRDDTETLIRYITRHHLKNITLHITRADFKNMRHYTRLIKSTDISTCYLPADFQYGKYMRTFFSVIERNNIALSISGSGRRTAVHEKQSPPPSTITCRNLFLSIAGTGQPESSVKHGKCGIIR